MIVMFIGKVIAPGIAIGPAAVWARAVEPVGRREVSAGQIQTERQRLEHALHRARRELEEIAIRVAVTAGQSAAAIFTAHGLLLEDRGFLGPMFRRIEDEHLAAESAVYLTIEEHTRRLAVVDDSYLAARAEDLTDLGQRLLTHLRKEGPPQMPVLPGPRVLIVENLAAADVIALDREHLLALVMIQSGATSHAALLAATLGVPAVGGIPELSGQVRDGDRVIVNGNHGQVLVNPPPLTVREYHTRREIFARFRGELAGLRECSRRDPGRPTRAAHGQCRPDGGVARCPRPRR